MTLLDQLDLADHDDNIAREAFRILLSGSGVLPISTLAERVGTEPALVRQLLENLQRRGRVEMHQDRLLGVYGLTLKSTEHRLTLRGSTFFTWCAFDVVGIPAALGESAEIASVCARCHTPLSLSITDGEPPKLPLVISWLAERCESVREQFCPTVNFYCDESHYNAALGDGQAPEIFLSLERAAEMGREIWGWAR